MGHQEQEDHAESEPKKRFVPLVVHGDNQKPRLSLGGYARLPGERLRTKLEAVTMTTGEWADYMDSTGKKHRIEEYGRNAVVLHTGGVSKSFEIEGVLIDGKKWIEYEDVGIGNPIEQAKQFIEEKIQSRKA